jgi:hypothetical protein
MVGNQYECPGRAGRNRPEHCECDQYTPPQLLLKIVQERDDLVLPTPKLSSAKSVPRKLARLLTFLGKSNIIQPCSSKALVL